MKHFVSGLGIRALAILVAITGFAQSERAHAQSLSTLMYFNGSQAAGGLTFGRDGLLYGVTSGSTLGSGALGGLIYRLTTDASSVATLYQYGRLGEYTGLAPQASLAVDASGTFYGVTLLSRIDPVLQFPLGNGTIFKITQNGAYTRLYSFSEYTTTEPPLINTDGARPSAGLLLANDGLLYGLTRIGGANGNGAIFKIATDGSGFTTLHSFAAGTGNSPDGVENDPRPITIDGAFPQSRLIQGSDGDLFGTTTSGGANGTGVIFRLRRDGTGFTVLRSFDAAPPIISDATDPNYGQARVNGSGGYPASGLVLGSNGYLYGTAAAFGASGFGTIYRIAQDGSNFSVLSSFDGATSGAVPFGELIVALDGTIVGTTSVGGTISAGIGGAGTLYSISLDGATLTTLHVFGTISATPRTGVVQGADGAFYGTTAEGGAYGAGTIFKFGTPSTAPVLGTPEPYDDGEGAAQWWLLAALAMLAATRAAKKVRLK